MRRTLIDIIDIYRSLKRQPPWLRRRFPLISAIIMTPGTVRARMAGFGA